MTVQVIGFMLQHAAHNATTFQHDRLAFQIDATHTSVIGATGLVPQSRHRQASLISVLFTAGLFEDRVEHIPDLAVDVIGKCPQIHANLIS